MKDKVLSVSEYIDLINEGLKSFSVKITGEVGKVDVYPSGHVYFSLRDEKDHSVINCAMWSFRYKVYGVKLEEGMKIISYGCPSIWKPNGKFSFIAETIELVGEGELKKKYEELKAKLTKEGIFEVAKKRVIPKYVQRIGIITSKQGAVLADFLSNIGKHGFEIKMIDSRVEGAEAIEDLLLSVRTFKNKNIEILVIMRGGGSFESLQAFNNESLVKEVASFPVPVIAAIGHDKDVPLVSLTADLGVSTPSIATIKINESWNKAEIDLERYTRNIVSSFENVLDSNKFLINNVINTIKIGFKSILQNISQKLDNLEKIIYANNPEKQLKIGYSIARVGDKIIRNTKDVKLKENIDVSVSDGVISSEVKNIKAI